MGYQLIAAMLVVLFFLLYKEQKSTKDELADMMSREIDKLRENIEQLEHVINTGDAKKKSFRSRAEEIRSKMLAP
jgi:predicted ribosome quality control (RQC) complex YloA/Tae2 family protein